MSKFLHTALINNLHHPTDGCFFEDYDKITLADITRGIITSTNLQKFNYYHHTLYQVVYQP